MRTRAYRFSGNTPAFPAQWLYDLYRALPGESEPLATIAPERRWPLKDLTPAIRASGPHDFAVRDRHHSSIVPTASTASRPAFRDDREPPLLVERDARIMQVIWVGVKLISANRKVGIWVICRAAPRQFVLAGRGKSDSGTPDLITASLHHRRRPGLRAGTHRRWRWLQTKATAALRC